MPISISCATLDDIEWILAQLKAFATFYGSKKSLFPNEDHAREGVKNIIENHVCYVAWQDQKRVGFISGYFANHPFNPAIRVLTESFWWVEEAYRGGRAGLKLLERFTDWGRENADWVLMSLIEGQSPINPKSLIKRGYHLHERAFLLELN